MTGLRRGSSSTTPVQLPAGATTPHAPHSPATSSLLLTRRSQGKLRRCTRVCEERGRMHTHQLTELLSAKSPVQMRYTNKTEPHLAAAAPRIQPPLCTQAAVITEVNTPWKKNKWMNLGKADSQSAIVAMMLLRTTLRTAIIQKDGAASYVLNQRSDRRLPRLLAAPEEVPPGSPRQRARGKRGH